MHFVKQLSFSDVNTGNITLGNVSTDCPSLIRASVCLSVDFDISILIAKLIFTPNGGSDIPLTHTLTSSSAIGYEYQLLQSPSTGSPGILTNVDGVFKINLDSSGSGTPTTGLCVLIVEVTTFPIS